MVEKRLVLLNASFSALQVLIVGFVVFLVYRFLIKTVGIDRLGIWSLVLATTYIASIVNLGFPGSVVKFIAKYNAQGKYKEVAEVIQTAIISTTLLLTFIIITIYPFSDWILIQIISPSSFKEAKILIPYVFLYIWLNTVANIYLSCIDGFQFTFIRSLILIISAILYLIFCYELIPNYRLLGLAYAQIIQAASIMLVSWLILKIIFPKLPMFPYKWDRKIFKELIGYGSNLQLRLLSSLLYDPLTKIFLSKFGGLSMVGFYEVAIRSILFIRTLVGSTIQILVPTIAHILETNPKNVRDIYINCYRFVFFCTPPLFGAIIAFSPYISILLIGKYESNFILFTNLLAFGWFINSLTNAAYFSNLGIGELRWNTISYITMGILNLMLGFIFGKFYGGKAVVLAWMLSIILASIMIPLTYHFRHAIPINYLFPTESVLIIFSSLVGIFITLTLYYRLHNELSFFILSFLSILVFISVLIIPAWRHPMRERLTLLFISDLLAKH